MNKINSLIDKYTKNKSRWSGKVTIDDEMKSNGKTNRKTGDIRLTSKAPLKTKIHELLHCRTKYGRVR